MSDCDSTLSKAYFGLLRRIPSRRVDDSTDDEVRLSGGNYIGFCDYLVAGMLSHGGPRVATSEIDFGCRRYQSLDKIFFFTEMRRTAIK